MKKTYTLLEASKDVDPETKRIEQYVVQHIPDSSPESNKVII
jgi:hypothetical protein